MKKILYFLLILPLFISCDEIIMEDDISGENLTLVAPADSIVLTSTSIKFTWNEIENGSQYRLQIARPNFTNPVEIITDVVVDTTSYSVQLNTGQYQWRVKGVNSAYETAYKTRSFTIVSNEDFQYNSISLTSPTNNIITNIASHQLSWQPVLGATGYHVQIIDNTVGNIEYEQDITATSLNYNFDEGSYKWQVRATNGTQNTLYYARNILTDYTAPNTAVLSLPAHLSTVVATDASFVWNRTNGGGSTEFDSLFVYTNSALTNLYYKGRHTSPYSPATLPNATYYWYVKAFDTAGNTGQQSNTFSFTVN